MIGMDHPASDFKDPSVRFLPEMKRGHPFPDALARFECRDTERGYSCERHKSPVDLVPLVGE